jgi:hypothetical protein
MATLAAAPALRPVLRSATADAAALFTIGVTTLAALATFRDYGLGWDDYTHAQMGELLLALYGSGFTDQRAFSFVNLYYYGGGFDMAAALAAKVLPLDLFEVRRLLGALVGIAGLALTWRAARRAGGPLAGALATVLLAACPLYYGHMFINPKDAPFAVAMVLLLLALMRLFETYPRASWPSVALLGLGLGAAIGTRVLGGMAALYAVTPQLVLFSAAASAAGFKTALAQLARFLLRLLPGFVLAYGLMGLLWPWSVLSPLNPLRAALYFDHFFEKPWRELYLGTLIPVPEMPWSYLPVLFGAKLPELFLVLSLAGIALAAASAARRSTPPSARAVALLLLGAVLVPLLVTLATRPALYNGVRHFLFLVPPLAVLAGLAGATMLEWLARRGTTVLSLGVLVFAAGIAAPVIEVVRLHPLEYASFNRLAGGVPGARNLFMLDYWGIAFKEAAADLRATLARRGEQRPADRPWTIAVCGPHPPAHVALGPDFTLTWDSVGADFALTLGEFYCRRPDAPVLAEVTREGVVFARAYDLRGRTVPKLLTLPPPE